MKPLRAVLECPRVLLREVFNSTLTAAGWKVVQLISLEVKIIWKCNCKIALHME
jgi:hypothetical protein